MKHNASINISPSDQNLHEKSKTSIIGNKKTDIVEEFNA